MKAETKARNERAKLVKAGVADEIGRVNRALASKSIIIGTAFGPYELEAVTPGFDYITHPEGKGKSWMNQRTFAGCNDGTWAQIMRDAGEKRAASFAALG